MRGFAVHRRGLVLGLLALLALAACTRMDLAYRNLDTLIPWSLDDYLDMNREQKAWFEDQLAEHLRWHCQTQLPGYLPWLDRLQSLVVTQNVSDDTLQALTRDAEQATNAIALQITPSAVTLLRDLTDEQVSALQDAFAKDIAKRRREQVAPPLAEQVETRAEKMHDRLKPWLGRVSPEQDAAIGRWSAQLGDHNRVALENRERWQQALLTALEHRAEPGFEARIAQLLQRREALWSEAYRADRANAQAAARALTQQILALSDTAQRRQLTDQLEKLRQRFAALRCLKKQ